VGPASSGTPALALGSLRRSLSESKHHGPAGQRARTRTAARKQDTDSNDVATISSYLVFRDCDLADAARLLAFSRNAQGLQLLLTYHAPELAAQWLSLLRHVPETESPESYRELLPVRSDDPSDQELLIRSACIRWRAVDWVENPAFIVTLLQQQLHLYQSQRRPRSLAELPTGLNLPSQRLTDTYADAVQRQLHRLQLCQNWTDHARPSLLIRRLSLTRAAITTGQARAVPSELAFRYPRAQVVAWTEQRVFEIDDQVRACAFQYAQSMF